MDKFSQVWIETLGGRFLPQLFVNLEPTVLPSHHVAGGSLRASSCSSGFPATRLSADVPRPGHRLKRRLRGPKGQNTRGRRKGGARGKRDESTGRVDEPHEPYAAALALGFVGTPPVVLVVGKGLEFGAHCGANNGPRPPADWFLKSLATAEGPWKVQGTPSRLPITAVKQPLLPRRVPWPMGSAWGFFLI